MTFSAKPLQLSNSTTTSPGDSRTKLLNPSALVRLIGAALLAVTTTLATFSVFYMRAQTEETYRRQIGDLGSVLAEQTFRYVQEIDLVLMELRERVASLNIRSADEFRQSLGGQDVHALLQTRLQNMAQVDALAIVDSTGHLLNSSRTFPTGGLDVADRDYFRHFITLNDAGAFVSAPMISRLNSLPTAFIARRINAPDGTFLGIVMGAIDIPYLTSFYRSINTQFGQSLTLLRQDGVILARDPDPTAELGKRMPADAPWYGKVQAGGGSYVSPGFLGGIPALVTVHPIHGYPLVFDTSLQIPVALSGWRHQALLLALAGALAGAVFVMLFWYLGRLFHREEQQRLALQCATHELEATLDNMDQGLMVIASDRSVPLCNRRAIELLDLPPELMQRHPHWDEVLSHQWETGEFAASDADFRELVRRTKLLDGPQVYDRVRPNGRVLEVRTTPLPGGEAVRTYTDITERKRAEQKIEFLAHHDGLTGLANRTLMNDRLSQALSYANRRTGQVAVLALDLDSFKNVNDTLGHAAGDNVLMQTADRLRQSVRSGDTIARIGGDEFIVIQTDTIQPNGAAEAAQRIIEALSRPLVYAGTTLQLGTSVGISIYPDDSDSANSLLTSADLALYRAKADGGGTYRMFEPEMDARFRERRELEHDLREAIAEEQLTLVFQPQLSCATGEVTGFEALARWQHPVRGAVPPSIFIPLAEELNLIGVLGAWALEQSCKTAASWPDNVRVAVNVSAAQFQGDRLPELINDVLRRTNLPATRLEVEVTETLLIDDPGQAESTLRQIRAMGVHVALDDFGTGYSSLSYLLRFPFSRVKIDKSFVQALGEDPGALSIVEAILAMARSLGMDVVAEGIETECQLTILRSRQCAHVQGFLLGRPMPPECVDQFIVEHADVLMPSTIGYH